MFRPNFFKDTEEKSRDEFCLNLFEHLNIQKDNPNGKFDLFQNIIKNLPEASYLELVKKFEARKINENAILDVYVKQKITDAIESMKKDRENGNEFANTIIENANSLNFVYRYIAHFGYLAGKNNNIISEPVLKATFKDSYPLALYVINNSSLFENGPEHTFKFELPLLASYLEAKHSMFTIPSSIKSPATQEAIDSILKPK